jgi:hypothetical protein
MGPLERYNDVGDRAADTGERPRTLCAAAQRRRRRDADEFDRPSPS